MSAHVAGGARLRLLLELRLRAASRARRSALAHGGCATTLSGRGSARFLHQQSLRQVQGPGVGGILRTEEQAAPASLLAPSGSAAAANTSSAVGGDSVGALKKRLLEPEASYAAARRAFDALRARDEKLREKHYLSLLYKASREGMYARVLEVFETFVADEKAQLVWQVPCAKRSWQFVTLERQQMQRFVLWSLLNTRKHPSFYAFYQEEVAGSSGPNRLGVYESDPLNFLLRLECTGKIADEEVRGLHHRVELLLRKMDNWKMHTSYSAAHALVRLMLHHPEVFEDGLESPSKILKAQKGEHIEKNDEGSSQHRASSAADGSQGELIVKFMDKFPVALERNPKRLSIAVSAAACAGQYESAKTLLKYAATYHVPIEAGSFAHAVACASDESHRMEIVDLYMQAQESQQVYTTHDEDSSVANYLLLYAVFDGNFTHMMELLHEMHMHSNKVSNKTAAELFDSIAHYRSDIRQSNDHDSVAETGGVAAQVELEQKLSECPTIAELFDKFPNALPRTPHTLSQGILQSLRGGDLSVALQLMRRTLWDTDVVLRPEVYAQLLYPLLAALTGGRRGNEANQFSEFDRVEVERCFDRQHDGKRVHLNALVLNLCASNSDLPTMMVCLDRWKEQRHPVMSRRASNRVFDMISKQIQRMRHLAETEDMDEEQDLATTFLVDGTQVSYLAFLARYRGVMAWDAWTLGAAIVRSGTSGLPADVVALLAEADSRELVLESAAYRIALNVLQDLGEPAAVVACAQRMQKSDMWETTATKFPEVVEILNRASENLKATSEAGDEQQ